ncbi:MAG: ribonuclease H-like domain-containing protein [Polyangiaceae bacterium]|nr:ribonuclease H-like domain-containing protein [Polyangiaceae bacterium]
MAALREKMAAILGRPPPLGPEVADPVFKDLPFVREETAEGPRYRRLEPVRCSHQVGRIPVDAARAARAEVLALLGLDPVIGTTDPARSLYFDTETTGLGGAGSVVFLFGAFWFDDEGQPFLEQLLLRQPGEERALLQRVAELFEQASLLVSYNGKTFDAPILAMRLVMNRLPPLAVRPHLDLLHVARRLHRARLGACRLTMLEREVLGFVRGEDIDGSEVPSRYSHFLRTGDEESLRVVVEHNACDVMTMAALVGLYGEPLDTLAAADLVALARTYRRARALDEAARVVDDAVARGVGDAAVRVRGDIAKARGDRAAALRDYESLCVKIDDPGLRLELAKLYEHHARQPLRALELTLAGTGETAPAAERRRARLERKIARDSTPASPAVVGEVGRPSRKGPSGVR